MIKKNLRYTRPPCIIIIRGARKRVKTQLGMRANYTSRLPLGITAEASPLWKVKHNQIIPFRTTS
jgi:hypothetical protein